VFLYIGGEGEVDSIYTMNEAWVEYAKKYHALLFIVEHRYYGNSHPTSDMSVENLKNLSSEQALADLAYFIVSMNNQHKLPPNTKWVAFGGSYAGSLAAWVRYKYPHLVHASVASSAPALAKVDFPEYLNVVKASLAKDSTQCVEDIESAVKEFNTLLRTSGGRKRIKEAFNVCETVDLNSHDDIVNLLETVTSNISTSVQYDNQGEDIRGLCDVMTNQSLGTPLIRLAQLNGPGTCLQSYNESIGGLKNISWNEWDSDVGVRQWMYQVCTEFGFLQTSERKDSLFGDNIPLEFLIQQCSDIFGKSFTKELLYRAVDRHNTIYGGMDLKATRVAYVHGSIDPWHAVGITKTRIPQSPAIFIQGASHCADMMSPSSVILPTIREAQKEISALIGKWLQEP